MTTPPTEHTPAPAGRIRNVDPPPPYDERTPVWVHTPGGPWPGRVIATAEQGRAALVRWSERGHGHERYLRTQHITPRDND